MQSISREIAEEESCSTHVIFRVAVLQGGQRSQNSRADYRTEMLHRMFGPEVTYQARKTVFYNISKHCEES